MYCCLRCAYTITIILSKQMEGSSRLILLPALTITHHLIITHQWWVFRDVQGYQHYDTDGRNLLSYIPVLVDTVWMEDPPTLPTDATPPLPRTRPNRTTNEPSMLPPFVSLDTITFIYRALATFIRICKSFDRASQFCICSFA